MELTQIKQAALGKWESIAPEVRLSAFKDANGNLKPFYLSRKFAFLSGDKFDLEIVNSADAYGKIPLVKMKIKGNIEWQGPHPIAEGAQKVDFTADIAYEVTPLNPGFADVLNKLASAGFNKWEENITQDILKKSFVPFGLADGQIFKEFDLIYLHDTMMFWGARNVDGRGFDTEENRPTNLQIPLIRQV